MFNNNNDESADILEEIECKETININEFSNYCRGCLNLPNKSDLVDLNLIYDEDTNITYYDCFYILTNINLKNEFMLPRNLCKRCTIELQMSYDFQKKLKLSQKRIEEIAKTIVAEETSTPIEEVDETELIQVAEEHLDENLIDSEDDAETIKYKYTNEEDIVYETITICDDENLLQNDTKTIWKQEDNIEQNQSESKVNDIEMRIENVQTLAPINDKEIPTYIQTALTMTTKPLNKVVRKRIMGKFSCSYCGKEFPNHSRMLMHQQRHEPDRPKYICEDCGRMYATKQAMEVHNRVVHEKVGFSCKICNKIYAVKKGLEVHMRYHTGDFPYVCDLCGKKFAQVCHLNTHKKVKHNSSRFRCEYENCNKYFTSSSSLRNHEFTHGVMPFECEVCLKGYPSKSKLKAHIRRSHGMDLTLEQLESMRKFYVSRSKLTLVKINETNES